MMKQKNFIAAIFVFLIYSNTVNALEIFNKDKYKLNFSGDAKGLFFHSEQFLDMTGEQCDLRVKLNGEIKLYYDLSVYANVGHVFFNKHGVSLLDYFSNTIGVIGVKLGKNELEYGRSFGVIRNALNWTEVFPIFNSDLGYTNTALGHVSSNLITFRNKDLFGFLKGFNFAVQLVTKDLDNNYIRTLKDSTWGILGSYVSPVGLGVIGAYAEGNNFIKYDPDEFKSFSENPAEDDKRAKQWLTTIKYDAHNIYLAATYGESHRAVRIDNATNNTSGLVKEAQNLALVAQYQFKFGLCPSIAYVHCKGKNINELGSTYLFKYIDVGAKFNINKNVSTFIDFRINFKNRPNQFGLKIDNLFALGISYKF
ncbi:MAG: hypothetical protein FT671_01805 [Pantoea sp. Brub]|nr:hypothetical protein [Pantoea sp. Brub]